jgi:type IV secretory pathway VirB4 component
MKTLQKFASVHANVHNHFSPISHRAASLRPSSKAARSASCSPTIEPQSREAYERFGLNDRQIELVSRTTPKRQYYLRSARGNRLSSWG